MTLDDKIEQFKNMSTKGNNMFPQKPNIAEEINLQYKQLAEWLEELKELRECKCKYFNLEHKECSISNNTYEDGYNKAIDDYENKCIDEIKKLVNLWEKDKANIPKPNINSVVVVLSLLAEQLKGEKNE